MYINTIPSRPISNSHTTRLLTLTHTRIRLDDPLIHLDPNHTTLPIIIIDTLPNRLLDRPR